MIVFYKALQRLVQIIEFLIIVRVFLSFMNVRTNNIIIESVFNITEPILSPIRQLMQKLNINTGYFDFSPLIAILLLRFLHIIIRRILFF